MGRMLRHCFILLDPWDGDFRVVVLDVDVNVDVESIAALCLLCLTCFVAWLRINSTM